MTDAERTPMQAEEQAQGTQTEPARAQEQHAGEHGQNDGKGLLMKLASAARNAATAVAEAAHAHTGEERASAGKTPQVQPATAVVEEQPADEHDEPSVVEQVSDLAEQAATATASAAQATAEQVKRVGARIYDRVVTQSEEQQPPAEAEQEQAAAGASFEPSEATARSGRPRRFKDVQPGMQLEGKVTSIALYGVFVDIGVGRDGLVHISEMSDTRIESPTDLVQIGDPVTVWVKSVDPDAWRISLTMRDPNRPKPQRERRGPRKPEVDRDKLSELRPGDTITGTVRSIAPFGAFVDIGVGKDGLVHISELSEDRVDRAEDAVQVGESYTFKVLDVDPEGTRISLSLRRQQRTQRLQQLEPGAVLEGTVSGMASFGAFVDIGVGRDGLVHISELSDERVNSVEDVVKVGDKVQVKVIEIDPNSKRISLTMRVDEPLPNERTRPEPQPAGTSQPINIAVGAEEDERPRGRGRKEQPRRRERRRGGRRETEVYEADEVYTYEDPEEEETFTGDATLADLVSKFNVDRSRGKNRRDDNFEEDEDEERGRRRRDAIDRTLAMRDEE